MEHDYLILALEEQKVDKKIIKIIEKTYKDASAYIKTERKGEPFKIERGIKQGDPLLSNLFNAIYWSKYLKN